MQNDEFVLTADNYYSKEANEHYMSFHTYLQYAGHLGVQACEAKAEAIRKGEWNEGEKSKAMLVGSYVDSYFEGTLDKFKAENPQIFTQKGELRADYKQT